uniref:B30.2/SPRY domain-containing protein n=1 Tax=Lates calcarifer TaxID=8187 RepID=A0A4W6F2D6_LATCA
MASDQMVVAALGRPFALGMLYDARNDKLNTAFTLWDKITLQEYSEKRPQQSSAYEITTSDSVESKSFLLDINSSLKASFLCGLVEVGGSASYLNDKKKYHRQSRVTFQYKATSMYEQLTMTDLKAKNLQLQEVIEKCSETHVVTGILYGAHAFFVFDSEKLDSNSVQDIQGGMEAVIKKIPSFSLEAKADVKLSDEEKAMTKTFSCKFYGDFILESNPATFEDAVKTYQRLPKLLGEKGENSVPVKVWLTPLKDLVPTALDLKGDICVGLLRKAVNALEGMREIEMRCNDSLEEKMVEKFPLLKKKLSRFQHLCNDYTKKLQQTMEEKLPSIREKSPFSQENLSQWLNNEEREINIIRSCVELMEGIKIVSDQSELDREVLDLDVKDALCFVFTSLKTTDPYLDQMKHYLCSHESQSGRCVAPPTKDQWYFSEEVLTNTREKARAFYDLAKALKNSPKFCFLVAAIPKEKYKGATIYHYRDGKLVTEDFSKPPVPHAENLVQNYEGLNVNIEIISYTANSYLILSEGNKTATYGSWQSYPDRPQRFDEYNQVLCREGLTGQHYWEVEWSDCSNYGVGVALAYRGIKRKAESGFGYNHLSWYFGMKGSNFRIWHNSDSETKPLPSTQCSRVGVFLDYPAGYVSFFNVSHNTLSHLHTFKSTFTEPLYPGLYSCSGSSAALENGLLKLL